MINSGSLDGLSKRDRDRTDHRPADGRGDRAGVEVLPSAGLADLPSALLGHPDPDDPHRGRPHRAGAGGSAAVVAARRGGTRPHSEGRFAAGRRHRMDDDGRSGNRRARPARPRHDGHVRRQFVVLPALPRAERCDGGLPESRGEQVGSGRLVHRRRRARDPAPAVRALHHQGPVRHGPHRVHRALLEPHQPGHGAARRLEDVQEQGQPGRIRVEHDRPGRRRRAGGDRIRGSGRRRHQLGGRVDDGRAEVPRTRLARRAGRHQQPGRRLGGRRSVAAPRHASSARGRARTGRADEVQRGRRAPDGARQRDAQGDRHGSRSR